MQRKLGPCGEVPFRDRPTDRQKVIYELYAEKVKEETGKIVDPEVIRAVRYTVLRWSERRLFDYNDYELETLVAHAKYNRRRDYALKLLAIAEQDLSRFVDESDDDDDPFLGATVDDSFGG